MFSGENSTRQNHNKRKRTNLRFKQQIVLYQDRHNITIAALATKFQTTEDIVRSALQNEELLRNTDHNSSLLEKINLPKSTCSKYNAIDSFIKEKIVYLRNKRFTVNKHTIKNIAERYLSSNPDENIVINDYFLRRFKKENGVIYSTTHGEAQSADLSNLQTWFEEFRAVASDYDQDTIYNMDETGLYIKHEGNKTYAVDKKDKHGSKKQKIRITVSLCCNQNNDFLPTAVIGHSASPRALKNHTINPKIKYYHSKKAWMTQSIFLEYLTFINQLMIDQDRKILLLVDNCSAHNIFDLSTTSSQTLSNIKLFALPANTTSILQPMDQGIINCFKNSYKKQLTQYLNVLALDEDLTYKQCAVRVTLREVLDWVAYAVEQISIGTTVNCWNVMYKLEQKYINFCHNQESLPELTLQMSNDDKDSSEFEETSEMFNVVADNRENFTHNSIYYYFNRLERACEDLNIDCFEELFNFKRKFTDKFLEMVETNRKVHNKRKF